MSTETMPSKQAIDEQLVLYGEEYTQNDDSTETGDNELASKERSKPRLLTRVMSRVQRYLEDQAKSAGSAADSIESHRTLGEVASDSWDSTKDFASEQYDQAKEKLVSAGQKTLEISKGFALSAESKIMGGLNSMGESVNEFVGNSFDKIGDKKELLKAYFSRKKQEAIERKQARVARRNEAREEKRTAKAERKEARAEAAKAERISELEERANNMQVQLEKMLHELSELKGKG